MPTLTFDCSHWISRDRYPVTELDSPAGQAFLQDCRHQFRREGVLELEGFVTSECLDALVEESTRYEAMAFHSTVTGNAYLDQGDPRLPADHARNLTESTTLGVVAYDQLPSDSVLRRLYEWEPLMKFVGAVLELPAIYRYADPMGALNLSVMTEGEYLRWHFDQSDFVTSLAIQSAERGGAFEYVPALRSADDENFDGVKAILQGSRQGVGLVPTLPGSLVLFRGRYCLHRVTPIEGSRSRLIGLLSYDTEPDRTGTDHLRQIRYGRTSPYTQE